MRFTTLLLLTIVLLGLSACDGSASRDERSAGISTHKSSESEQLKLQQNQLREQGPSTSQPVSLNQADAANTAAQAAERKIIRNANLTIEVNSPTESQRKIASIAESHQGFVVTSEATQRTTEDRTKPEITVNLVVRVPAAQFNQVMEEIRAVGLRVIQEKITGQDVTEEFMDLEARIKNQKALEIQFLEIMKRAGKVEDALSVQRELAEVRTEIEKLEGRRRYLENQASLSTINVTLQPPTQIVNATGFWYSVKSAFSEGVDVAAAIILFLIRAIIALIPVLIFIVLPFALIAKLVIGRMRRHRGRAKKDEEAEAVG
jgi:murein DD-endopeptidase MepM/ murein hydrolase activator NlpD